MKLALTFALLALSGCASTGNWIERHPTATSFIVWSVASTALLSAHHGGSHGTTGAVADPAYTVSTPLTPDCARLPEMCK